MIRAHRRRHLRAFAALAVVLPAILLTALTIRRTPPVVASAPATLTGRSLDAWVVIDSVDTQVLDVPIRVRLLAPSPSPRPSRLGVELEPTRAIGRPDVLTYWTETPAATSAGVPADAQLLGSMGGTRPHRFELPPAASRSSGNIIVYSAAHREVLGTIPVPQAPDGTTPQP